MYIQRWATVSLVSISLLLLFRSNKTLLYGKKQIIKKNFPHLKLGFTNSAL